MENNTPLSRVEDILQSTIDNTEYDKPPQSRVESLLIELKEVIEGGGGGGSAYHPAGSVDYVSELPSPSADYLGYVYDITQAFTTTSDFKEGAGKRYPAGSNIAIVDVGTPESPSYKYDVLSGFIDTSNFVEKEEGKGLSTNDYTDADKTKLASLENYDDTEIRNEIAEKADDADLAAVAKSGSYNDLADTPDIPTATSDLTNDSGFVTNQIDDTTVSASTTYSSSKIEQINAEYPIASATTGINPSITDSADGFVQYVKVYGRSDVSKNILNPSFVGTSDISISSSDSGINVTTTTTIPQGIVIKGAPINLKAGVQYVLSGTGAVAEVQLSLRDANGNYSPQVNMNPMSVYGGNYATVIASQDVTIYPALRVQTAGAISVFVKPQLELGSTPTPYEPYFPGIRGIGEDGEIDVVTCGKNLLDNPQNNSVIAHLIPDTYTLSFDYTATGAGTYGVNLVNSTAQEYISQTTNTNVITFEVNSACDVTLNAWFVNGAGSFNGNTSNWQLELGSTATAYEPYVSTSATVTTGIPLYSVGDVKDEMDEKKGVVIKRCGAATLTGSAGESYNHTASWENAGCFSITNALPGAKSIDGFSTIANILSDIGETTTPEALAGNIGTVGIAYGATNTLYIAVSPSITTEVALKTYLASNPVTVVYELAEPYEIPLTSAELSALRNLRTYNPTTNVTITDSPAVDVGYLLDTDNGQAVADVQNELQGQISNIPAWLTGIPENHKNIYRGKLLGNSVSAAQLAAIADGSFDDLYVGDYWEIPVTIDGTTVSNKWRIADFDYFLHNGTDKHHAVIVPDNILYTAQIGGTISNGYYQSAMFTTNLNKGRTAIADAFPDMVISYEYYDIIGQTATKYDCTAELMTLSSLTGAYSDYIHTNYLPVLPQMSLFRIMRDFIGANSNGSGHDAGFLTQTVKDNSKYWSINTQLSAMGMTPSDSYGVRPFFLLGDASNI